MLKKASDINTLSILSFQTCNEIAKATRPIINPDNLKILAYEVEGHLLDSNPKLLRLADIRELSSLGMIIDSSDELVEPDEIISLEKFYKMNFNLDNFLVIDENKNKIGKVIDYTINLSNFFIWQLIVKRPFLKSFNDPELIIDRSQIKEINDDYIVIKKEIEDKRSPAPRISQINKDFTNPFTPLPEQQSVKIKK